MSEAVTLDQYVDEDQGEMAPTQEEVKETLEGDLVPAGIWPGQLQSATTKHDVIATKDGDHPLEGRKVWRCDVILFLEDGEKHFFFDAIFGVGKIQSRKGGLYTPPAFTNANFLTKATKLFGQPAEKVMRAAAESRFQYNVKIKKEHTDKETGQEYAASNVLKGIYQEKEEANG